MTPSQASRASDPNLSGIDWGTTDQMEWRGRDRCWRRWELVASGAPIAALERSRWWSDHYRASTETNDWIVQASPWRRRGIRRPESPERTIEVRFKGFRRVELRRAAGDPLILRREGLFGRAFVLENSEGFPLFHLRFQRGWMRLEASLHLEDAARSLPDLEALLLLCWAVAVERRRQH